MARRVQVSNTEHPLALGSFRSWSRLLSSGGGVDREFVLRALFVSFSTLLSSPLRVYERIRYTSAVNNTEIHPSPIFIVGHWRTGTTYLHHLLCQDPGLGYVSTFQAFAPGLCLVGEKTLKRPLAVLARRRHPTREIDDVPLLFDNPEEEELAVANLTPYSVLHWYSFPRRAAHFFERYALLDGLSESTLAEWSETYCTILRKASLRNGGKRLVVKNCANTARIRTLRDLFPEAKFIHITRNPYNVYCSTMHLYRIVLERTQLQRLRTDEIEENVLRFYVQLMERYLADRTLVPAANLAEVRFEDLELAPLDKLRRLYERLDLPGFSRAESSVRAYLESVAGYQKNHYELDDRAISQVNRCWQFAFDEWGYERLDGVPS
jgi:hypothetical protein